MAIFPSFSLLPETASSMRKNSKFKELRSPRTRDIDTGGNGLLNGSVKPYRAGASERACPKVYFF